MSNEYLHAVREFELALVLTDFPAASPTWPDVRVLDIGAGTGHQSALLQARGYRVTAVDLPASDYASERVFPILDYDGTRLPLPDASVDVVFSSNVLEHVQSVDALLDECRRVLADGGVAIHVLPTPAWRWWTTLTHYPWLVGKIWQRFVGPAARREVGHGEAPRSMPSRWWKMLWPERHGERGTVITEPFYFSQRWWRPVFARAGFKLEKTYPNGLFYTGNMLFAGNLPLPARSRLARWLGSACRVYVMRARRPGDDGHEVQLTSP